MTPKWQPLRTVARTALTTEPPAPVLDVSEPAPSGQPLTLGASLQVLRDGLLCLLRRQVRDHALAEDLCSEAFRILFERLRNRPLEDPEKIAAFLAQTARNLAIAEYRKSERRRTVTGEDSAIRETADPAADPASGLERAAQARAIRQVLEELPTRRDRELLVRYYLRDEPKSSICTDLGLTDEHFNRVIFRARARFRSLLEMRHGARDLYSTILF